MVEESVTCSSLVVVVPLTFSLPPTLESPLTVLEPSTVWLFVTWESPVIVVLCRFVSPDTLRFVVFVVPPTVWSPLTVEEPSVVEFPFVSELPVVVWFPLTVWSPSTFFIKSLIICFCPSLSVLLSPKGFVPKSNFVIDTDGEPSLPPECGICVSKYQCLVSLSYTKPACDPI